MMVYGYFCQRGDRSYPRCHVFCNELEFLREMDRWNWQFSKTGFSYCSDPSFRPRPATDKEIERSIWDRK